LPEVTVEQQEIATLEHALPGVAVREAVERMAGNLSLYRKLLRSYADIHRDTAIRLKALWQTGNQEQLYLEAHNLKGEAGNLGFQAIRACADTVCLRLKSGQENNLVAAVEALAQSCSDMLVTLDQLMDSATVAPVPTAEVIPLNLDLILPMLQQFASQLQAKNLGARKLANDINDIAKGTSLATELGEACIAAQHLHYDVALTAVQQLAQREGWQL
jgi:HPt (histidine-containing phosphotransfer) domain-containing protein